MGVDIVSPIQEYIRSMIDKVGGLKVLLLDSETTAILSMVFSQSQILEKDVFLVERVDSNINHKGEGTSGGDIMSSSSSGSPSSTSSSSTSSSSTSSSHTAPRNLQHLNAICFVRPIPENFLHLARELRHPQFKEYHIYFSNTIPSKQLQRLAKCDDYDRVVQVHEYYADVLAVNRDLFSLSLPSLSALMTLDQSLWSAYESSIYTRMIDGLFSVVAALKLRPAIRFLTSSSLCSRLASHLNQRMNEQRDLLDLVASLSDSVPSSSTTSSSSASKNANLTSDASSSSPFYGSGNSSGANSVLLLLDRREDPVTPLLNQWTYQAMLQELIGIVNNRVDLKKVRSGNDNSNDSKLRNGATNGNSNESEEIVMNPFQDLFYNDNIYQNFGELGINVKRYVTEYQTKTKSHANIESIEEMQKFVDSYPEFRRLSGNVSKHVTVIHELSRIVEERHLLEVSSVEQSLACKDSRSEHLKLMLESLRSDKVTSMDKLRLVLLFSLRYEGDSYIPSLKAELKKSGIDADQVNLVDALLKFAGMSVRSGDLFQNKNFLSIAKNTIQRGLKGTPNVYTQHKSLLSVILDNLLKGRLKQQQYGVYPPYHLLSFDPDAATSFVLRERPQQIIVFIVGGVTYEEARDAAEFSAQTRCRVLLGGSSILSTCSFLADVAQLSRQPPSTFHHHPQNHHYTGGVGAGTIGVGGGNSEGSSFAF